MKKRGLIIFDIVMTVIVVIAMILSSKITNNQLNVKETKLYANNSEYSFVFDAEPDYSRAKAGDTVVVKLNLKDLRMGENGLNNVIGYVTYDESVFDELNIEGIGDWNFERNEDKNHEMFGKFVIYTMKEGVTENQDVVQITAKLKADLEPQTTEIKFTGIKSSEGEVSVDGADKTVVIEIYKESKPQPKPQPEPTPDEPVKPDDKKIPDSPKEQASIPEDSSSSIRTGDTIQVMIFVLVVATIALNIVAIRKDQSEENKNGLKLRAITSAIIVAVGLIVLSITAFAQTAEITNLINSLDHKESWLNSDKYLVTDESVSRIAPLTNIADIEHKFNKEIDVFKAVPYEKTTEGLVKTGMWILDGQNMYRVSVLGDVNGDGESNQVELTNIIRATVNSAKWNYSGVEKLSADMNVDGTINNDDVNTSIRYILYGELDIPGFNQVEEPKIEVVGGTYNETIEAYEDTITIKISEQDENATKTMYKVEGKVHGDYAEIEDGGTINLSEDGVYKISAYSYGALGNRSEIPYIIVVKKNPNNQYRVKTRSENVDGTYTETTEEKTGRIGETVTAGEPIPEGYEINEDESTLQGVIKENEVIELVVTLDRKEYTLTLNSSEYISSVKIGNEANETTISKSFKFGKSVDISADVKQKDGYTTEFYRWQSSNTNVMADIEDKDVAIKMPMSNITLTAIANRRSNTDTPYKVEYYYQENGLYKTEADNSTTKGGETETEVSVDDIDKMPTRAGYVLDESKQEDYTGIIKGDGSTILKVYFKQQFTVTYKPGDKGTFTEEKTAHIDYGSRTPAFEGELTCQDGYEFDGWDKDIADRVTENVEYTANWKEVNYNILYALDGGTLGVDGEGHPITNPGTYTVNTESFTLHNPTKVGYRFLGWTGTGVTIPNQEVTIAKGSTGDRNYRANWEVINYNITYELNGGNLGVDDEGHPITNKTTYNAETPTFTLYNPKKTGYTFLGWTGTGLSEATTNVTIEQGSTGDRSYEANWSANSGIEYKVRYYLENLDSTDSSDKDNFTMALEIRKSGTTDMPVRAEIRPFAGFLFDENNPNNYIEAAVAGDGSLVLEVYYTRASYELTLEKDENVDSVSGAGTYKYGQPVEINAILKTQTGYTITFVKWKSSTSSSSGDDYLEDKFNLTESFEMPAGNVTLTALSNKVADRVNYTVEYYYQQNGAYPTQVPDEYKAVRNAETDTNVFVTDNDKIPTQNGYAFDETKTEYLSGIVNGDGSTVLKVYFKEQFTVTYKSGIHGVFKDDMNVFTEQKTENLDYNSTTPNLEYEIVPETGYEFTGWDKTVDSKVTRNIEYVAEWNATQYDIDYELNGGDLGVDQEGHPITNKSKYTVETDTFTLNNPTKVGYRFLGWTGTGIDNIENPDQTVPQTTVTIEKGSIGNRSYEAKWEIIECNITYDLDGGALPVGITNPDKYTVETETFSLKNPGKTGYTFLGWTGTDLTEATNPVTITKGSTGDRSYLANWSANSGVTYHVQYYQEKLESNDSSLEANYTLAENTELDGTTGAPVVAEQKTYIGFTFDANNPNNKLEGNIEGDGSLTLKLFYTRNSYELTLAKDENVDTVSGHSVEINPDIYTNPETGKATYKFEQPIEIGATLKTQAGYTITFTKWESSNTDLISDKETKEASITMPAGNITLTAISEKTANDASYNVEYYYEGTNGYPDIATSSVSRQSKVDQSVEVTDQDKVATQSGYEFDENAGNVLEGTIPATGTLTLKVYFKKSTYTLTVVAGDGISSVSVGEQSSNTQVEKAFKFGDTVNIDAIEKTETGYNYVFTKWSSNNQSLLVDQTAKQATFTMPAGDITLTAVANKEAAEVSYNVEFYYQENGTYPAQVTDENRETRQGLTEAIANVTNLDKEPKKAGYVYDENNEKNVESHVIAADGSTILKLYFKQVFTVTYKPGEHGNFEEAVLRNIDYGADIPEYTGSKTGADGYVFASWKLTKVGETDVTDETPVPTTVTNNLEYTAQWTRMSVPTITHTPTAWTNQNVTVTITKPENHEAYGIEYSIDDSNEWIEYLAPFEVEQNCEIHARLADGDNKGDIVDHEITNIDKVKPVFVTKTVNEVSNEEASITVKGTDDLSKIVEYGITRTNYGGTTTYTCEPTLEQEVTYGEIFENGTYTLYYKDAAGNIKEDTVEVVHITEYNVAKIVAAPAGFESLIGTEYTTLRGALDSSDEAAQVGNVKIEIIHNIHNEANTIKLGRDYTINLNNYTVKNLSSGNAFTVNGKLKVTEESQNGEGTIISPYGTGIFIPLTGELTLGEDEGGVPSIFAPIVEGKVYGIQKEIDNTAEKIHDEDDNKDYYPESKFNFYDGKIIGKKAALVAQKVNDTPALYDPTVKTNTETGNQESTLAVVSNIEAVIGKRRYMLLEDAIAAANNTVGTSNEQVEIKIVKDITKDGTHKVVVDQTKNIKLDLNGFLFTTTSSRPVIENLGRLEIVDSSESIDEETGEKIPGTGKIFSTTGNTIVNSLSDGYLYNSMDLNSAVQNGEYYFEVNEAGELVNNNVNISSSTAHSYFELDLTDRTENVMVNIEYSISSEARWDCGYVIINESPDAVEYDVTDGRKIYVSGLNTNVKEKFELEGGRKYYIHIGYRKDGSADNNNDSFIIKDIKIGSPNESNENLLKITSGTIECSKAGTDSEAGYNGVIINDGNLVIDGGNINSTASYTAAIINSRNSNDGKVRVNGGNISSSVYATAAVFNFNEGIMNLYGGSITSGGDAIYNKAKLNVLGENVEINSGDYHTAIVANQNSKTTIENGKIYGHSKGIYRNHSTAEVTIKGGEITTPNTAIENYASGQLKIENVTIKKAQWAVYNRADNAEVIVDNITMNIVDDSGIPTVDNGFQNDYYDTAKITLNNGNVYVRYRAAINQRAGTIEVNGGNYSNYQLNNPVMQNDIDTYFTSSSKGVLNIKGGTITSQGSAVYNGGDLATITIKGGTLESKTGDAVVNPNNGTITIGEKAGQVSTESPSIKAVSSAVNSSYGKLYFYDGVLIGQENNVIKGQLDEVEEGYDLRREIKSDNLQYVTLGIPTEYVAKIAASDNPVVTGIDENYYKLENGYYYFKTLEKAVKSANKLNQTTIDLIADEWVIRTIEVEQGQNIILKTGNHTISSYAELFMDNNGYIKLINEDIGNKGIIKTNASRLLTNNASSTLQFENIKLDYQRVAQNKKLIDNFGTLNMNNVEYYVTGNSRSTYSYDIYNEDGGIVDINNSNFSGYHGYAIYNESSDATQGTTIKAVTIKNTNISLLTNEYSYGLYNNSDGTIDAYNVKMTGYYSTYSVINESNGKIYLDECEVCGYAINNKSTGYIEVNNTKINSTYRGIVNESTGKILLKGEQTTTNGGIYNLVTDGTIEIQGGTYNHDSNSSYNIDNSGKIIIKGGTINENGYNAQAIRNKSGGEVTISGSDTTIYSLMQTAIENEGTLTITNAKVTGNGLYGISNSGTLTIGEKDGNVKYVPTVYGLESGIYNTGTLNLYDGIINGKDTKSITGVTATDIESGCMTVIYKGEAEFDDGTENKYQIASGREISVVEDTYVAHVVSLDRDYKTIAAAFAAAGPTDTIELIHDASISGVQGSAIVESEKNITLDLKGYNVIAGNENTIVNNGTLTVTDTTSHLDEDNKVVEGKFINGANTIIDNNGTCTINAGTYELTLGGAADGYYNLIDNSGTVTIAGGTLKVDGAYSNVINSTSGTVTVTGGTISAKGDGSRGIYASQGTVTINNVGHLVEGGTAIYCDGNAKVTMTDGHVKGNIYSKSTDKVIINNGTIEGRITNDSTGEVDVYNGNITNGIYNQSTGKVEIYDGTINVGYGFNSGNSIYNNGGTINIYGGSIADVYNISGMINITGGSFFYNGGSYNVDVIQNGGTLNIDGTSLTSENPITIGGKSMYDVSGITMNNTTCETKIKGHVVIDTTGAGETGIGIEKSGGSLEIGDIDNITNNVKINSKSYGVTGSNWNYYGGTITAPQAVDGIIDEIPNGYDIIKSYDSNNNEVYEIGIGDRVARVGDTYYGSLKSAIADNDNGTIVLLKDLAVPSGASITIEDTKNLVLDLNGHTIKLHMAGTYITNEGTLKIIDDSVDKTGSINNRAAGVIINKGNLEIADGNYNVSLPSEGKMIYNTQNGEITISGGTYRSSSGNNLCIIVYSDNGNEIKITGGDFAIDIYGYVVYASQPADISIKDATFSGSYDSKPAIVMQSGTMNVSGTTKCTRNVFADVYGSGIVNISGNVDISRINIGDSRAIYDVNISGGKVHGAHGNEHSNINITGGEITGDVGYFGNVQLKNGAYIHNAEVYSCNEVHIYSGATIESDDEAIENSAYVYITGGTITGKIRTGSSGEVDISGGTITGNTYAIECSGSGKVNVTGGTVTATDGIGILINGGTVTLGENTGGYPSTTIPPISGSTYGIKNVSGTLQFYDGIVTGETAAIDGNVNKTPSMFKVQYSQDNKEATLVIDATFEQIATVNGTYYDDLQSAIDAAARANTAVEICKDIVITTPVTIAAGDSVTIDLAGFSITGYQESGAFITNNGDLTIIDSISGTTGAYSKVESGTGVTIENNGTLTLGVDDGIQNENSPRIMSENQAVSGSGVVTVYDGKIQGSRVTVSFNSNGGTTPSVESKMVHVGDTYGELPTITKEGYTFLGWSTLPSEYEELEYIEFNSGNYIDTGIVPRNHMTEIKFDFNTYTNNEVLIGTEADDEYYHFTGYSDKYYWGRSGDEIGAGTWTTGSHTLVYNADNNAVILDGDTLGSGTNITSQKTLWIGKKRTVNNFQGKVYYMKVTDKSNGKVVRNMIPCYRTTDDVIGMYDVVNGVFYENAGTGTFTKGDEAHYTDSYTKSSTEVCINQNHDLNAFWGYNPVVTLNANGGTVDSNTKTIAYNGTYGELPTPTKEGYTFLGWSELPEEYQKVEYVEFNSGNYIDTGIVPSNHRTDIIFDFDSYTNNEVLMGTGDGDFYYHFTAYRDIYYWGRSGSETHNSSVSWTTGVHSLAYNGDGNSVYIDGYYLGSGYNITSAQSLWIGKKKTVNNLEGKVYYMKITDKSTGEVVREFIPCYRTTDNVIGMYDLVNGVFYTNQGTGTFDKGNDITITSESHIISDNDHTIYAKWKENE